MNDKYKECMNVPENIVIKPVGVVKSSCGEPQEMPILGQSAIIEVFPEKSGALLRIEENSHLWILTWFHQARRDVLATVPARVNPNLPKYGVFGLRSPVRPNPVGLTLVQLDKVEGNKLYVAELDAIDGTPVIDIKPYFDNDIIFSPRTPHIWPLEREMRKEIFLKQALNHHQELCSDLYLAVRMAMLAEERLGRLNSKDLYVLVEGSSCLADTLQGLTRARLANPSRFEYWPSKSLDRSTWQLGKQVLNITTRRRINLDEFRELTDDEIFDVSENLHL